MATSYAVSYTNTNPDCFTISYQDIVTTQTNAHLSGLQEGTQYSITITSMLSNGKTGRDTLTVTTLPIGLYNYVCYVV